MYAVEKYVFPICARGTKVPSVNDLSSINYFSEGVYQMKSPREINDVMNAATGYKTPIQEPNVPCKI